ncbi:hypothetical protein [Streptomyces sp. CA-251251]|uniref:hypothetical protein n=1 Tax=Streptomyces sp. CA-251251 TaxID=3240063 RepID=UPI003D8E9B37
MLPTSEQPLGEYIAHRHDLHRDLVDALDRRDRDEALRLIHEHNTSLHSSEDPTGEHRPFRPSPGGGPGASMRPARPEPEAAIIARLLCLFADA